MRAFISSSSLTEIKADKIINQSAEVGGCPQQLLLMTHRLTLHTRETSCRTITEPASLHSHPLYPYTHLHFQRKPSTIPF